MTRLSVLRKYQGLIEKFWLSDTVTAFNAAANAIEQAWQDEIANEPPRSKRGPLVLRGIKPNFRIKRPLSTTTT